MNTATQQVSSEESVLEVVERKVESLDAARFKSAEYERVAYVVTAHENTVPSDLLKPEYWAHVAAKLRSYDRIEARANDETWYAEYLVVKAGSNWANVIMLDAWPLTSQDVIESVASASSALEAQWRGPHSKWSVIRKSDKAVLKEGMSKDEANRWIHERQKAE